jgi:hypothetical protein
LVRPSPQPRAAWSRGNTARLRWLIAPTLAVLAAVALFGCRLPGSYPGVVTTPEVIGLVASITTDPDLTAHVALTSGQTVVVRRSDRSLGGLGDLLFLGTKPDRWYLAAHKSEKPGCYWVAASRAYSEVGTVVLAFEVWPGVGIRLPKAPGFDDSKLVTTDSEGRLVYSAIGAISLCSDADGRISGRG